MNDLSRFSYSARTLSRNPLGIIALFIVLIYGCAALTLGISRFLVPMAQLMMVGFLITFPFCVLLLFGWLVSQHHQKLYAPADFKTDESFLIGVRAVRARHTAEVQEQQEKLKNDLREKVLATDDPEQGRRLADIVADEFERQTTFVVDARKFMADQSAIYQFPIAAFERVGDLYDEIYLKIADNVRPYEYGFSWVLQDHASGSVIRSARMITGTPPGVAVADNRSLREVGITAGCTLVVSQPSTHIQRPHM